MLGISKLGKIAYEIKNSAIFIESLLRPRVDSSKQSAMGNVMSAPLEKEFDYFLAHKRALLRKYKGRFVVIKGTEVIGDFAEEPEAVRAAVKGHRPGTFLVQKVEPGTDSYTHTFHTGVALA